MSVKGFRVDRRCWVKPAGLYDAAPIALELEPLDNLLMREGTVQSVIFFPEKLDAYALKSSLGLLLSAYPFLVGRAWQPCLPFLTRSPAHGWRVRGRQGVAFSVATAQQGAGEVYEQLARDSSADVGRLVDVRSTWAILWGMAPVMTVRITEFQEGGSAFGVAVAGGLVDEPGLQELVHEWFRCHMSEEKPEQPRLKTDRSSCLPRVRQPDRCGNRFLEVFCLANCIGWGISYLVYWAPQTFGAVGYVIGVLFFLLPVVVAFRYDKLQPFLFCFTSPDLIFFFLTLGKQRSRGGTRIRLDLSSEEVQSVVGHSLQEAHRDPTGCGILMAEAALLLRMAEAVAGIMDFAHRELQVAWAKDTRAAPQDGIARTYIGPAMDMKVATLSLGRSCPPLDDTFDGLRSSECDVPHLGEWRAWMKSMKSHPPKGMFLEYSQPFISCVASLASPVLDWDWGAGKPIGVMAASNAAKKVCEVLPAAEGGAALYFNLSSVSWVVSFLAQSPPSRWTKTVQSAEFRESLLKPREPPQGKRSRQSNLSQDSVKLKV